MTHIHILNTTNATTASGYLLSALKRAIVTREGDEQTCHISYFNLGGGVRKKVLHFFLPNLARTLETFRCDTLIVHTSVIFSLGHILLAKILRKRVIAIFWDVYPGSFVGVGRGMGAFAQKVYTFLETGLLKMCDKVLLPTTDYENYTKTIGLSNTEIFPLWPFTTQQTPFTSLREPSDKILHIGFAGTVNPLRGIEAAILKVANHSDCHVHMHLFTAKPLALAVESLPKNLTLTHHGFIDQNVLVETLRTLDAGLVCLNKAYLEPAFPSKIVSNICSGIPIIYSGPRGVALSKFLKKHNVGITVEDKESGSLYEEIQSIKHGFAAAQASAIMELNLNEVKLDQIL